MSTSTVNPLAKDPRTAGPLWVEVTIPVLLLTTVVVGIRVWWRRKVSGKVALSDITILVSLFCAFMQEILGCIGVLKWGLGHHAAYIGSHKTQKALMYFYLYQIFYKIVVATTKMSFVFLYLDLFPIPKFKMVCHVVNASLLAAMIAFVAGTIFQCTPIPFFWNRKIPGGHCIGVAAFWYGHAAWNTAADVLVLLLPIPVIRSLQMGNNQKVAVLGVFGLGAFVIVASIMRMIALDPASKTTQMDMTYVISTSNAFLWTQLETCVGIICACLPTLKGPLGKLLPTLFASSRGRSTRDAYEIDTFDQKRSAAWKDTSKSSRNATRSSIDDSSSQERIIGITKTVDVQVTTLDSDTKGRTTAQGEMFRAGNRG